MDRRLSAPLSLLVAGALLLAGCTSPGAEPSPSPSPTVGSPSPSPSPTPTLTQEETLLAQIPDEAKGDDLLAAVEMAKFFITLHPGLYQGEDPALFAWLSLPECEFCSSSLEVTEERLADGIVQVGGDFTIPDQVEGAVIDPDTDNTTTALVGFHLTYSAYVYQDANGEVTLSSDGGQLDTAIAMRHMDGLWRIYGVGLE